MSGGAGPASNDLGAIQANLVSAADRAVAQVVAMVDAMPHRGAADDLIAALRPRLAQLRPVRPLGFTRLVFTPLDTLVVPPAQWERGSLSVPRTALSPIARALKQAMPDVDVPWSESGISADGHDPIASYGRLIWPRIAGALPRDPPQDWVAATGLAERDYAPIAQVIGAVSEFASDIHELAGARGGPADAQVKRVLAGSLQRGATTLAAVVAVLMARLPVPGQVVAMAAELAGAGAAVDLALNHSLATAQASLTANGEESRTDVMQVAIDAGRVAVLLSALEIEAGGGAERRALLDQVRRSADTVCRNHLERAIESRLLLAARSLPQRPLNSEIAALEANARDLRRLDRAGRRFGNPASYEALIEAAIAPFRAGEVGPLGLADRVRIVEILAGPDEALSLL